MIKEVIDGAILRDMFLFGAAQLEKNKAYVDSLNVFPVPDGDTGSNMAMTMQGAAKEVQALPETANAEAVFSAASRGALRNARGNSGVILSQIFRGFMKAAKGKEAMEAADFAAAFLEGTSAAYKAVLKPKEGTILTVSRRIGEAAQRIITDMPGISCTDLMRDILKEGEEALKATPELLPVLKEAGVVDSGGKGLMFILTGFYMALTGENAVAAYAQSIPEEVPAEQSNADIVALMPEEIEFGYCTEFFIVRLQEGFGEEDLEIFRRHLLKIGDSVVLVADSDTVKVHVHSNCPGKILQMAMHYGELDRLKIENMREQNRQLNESRKKNRSKHALVAVSTGTGIDKIFRELSVHQIIPGGQTMNPSIDTIVNAVRRANADTVYVLPNNSNIILAATQATSLCDSNVVVIPTKSVPQGIYAAMAFNPEADTAEENTEAMRAAAEAVTSGAVTYAVRETVFMGRKISEGDIIGMMNGDICAVTQTVAETAKELVNKMLESTEDDEASVSVYYGSDFGKDAASALVEELEQAHPNAEFSLLDGGQPLYFLYFSVI